MAERRSEYDRLRGWAMLLVVVGHGCFPRHGGLVRWIFSFQVPLFLYVSGLIQGERAPMGWKAFWTRRVGRLCLEYGKWFLVAMALAWILSRTLEMPPSPAVRPEHFLDWMWGWTPGPHSSFAPTPLWFLPFLVSVEILHRILMEFGRFGRLGIAVLACVGPWIPSLLGHRLPWGLEIAPAGLLFLEAGRRTAGLVKRSWEMRSFWRRTAGIAGVSLQAVVGREGGLSVGDFGDRPALFAYGSILACVSWALLAPDLPRALLTTMGRRSLVFLGLDWTRTPLWYAVSLLAAKAGMEFNWRGSSFGAGCVQTLLQLGMVWMLVRSWDRVVAPRWPWTRMTERRLVPASA